MRDRRTRASPGFFAEIEDSALGLCRFSLTMGHATKNARRTGHGVAGPRHAANSVVVAAGASTDSAEPIRMVSGEELEVIVNWRDRYGNAVAAPPAGAVTAVLAPVSRKRLQDDMTDLPDSADDGRSHSSRASVSASGASARVGSTTVSVLPAAAAGVHGTTTTLVARSERAGVFDLEVWHNDELVHGDALEVIVAAGTPSGRAPLGCSGAVPSLEGPLGQRRGA